MLEVISVHVKQPETDYAQQNLYIIFSQIDTGQNARKTTHNKTVKKQFKTKH